jgi:uncharacterized protein (TIGR00251 family)
MIALGTHTEGVVLPVRAQPGARANAVRGEHRGALKVAVTQAPEKGKANRAVVELLSRELQLARSQFTLLSGDTSHDKRFVVSGIAAAELAARLQALLERVASAT